MSQADMRFADRGLNDELENASLLHHLGRRPAERLGMV